MNWYFYRVWMPLQILTIAAFIAVVMGLYTVNWWVVLVSWFLIGPVGTGVGYHRLFSHRQFTTWKPVEYTIAFLGTLAAYAPVLFWASQHQYHHTVADTEDDPSSPKTHGFWESFLWWRMRDSVLKKIDLRCPPIRMLMKDKVLMFFSKQFTKIIYTTVAILALVDINLLISLFIIPVFIEHMRVNAVSSLSHINVPFSYKNFETKDQGQNNILFGYITCGFGWHNNHHALPRKLINQERWWEVDIEGIVAWLLTKRSYKIQ
jgi:stearoyl-CoA desaturase (delta-9 desaturase)